MNRETHIMLSKLESLGISPSDAAALRRISMTLHRWHELECGLDSSCIVRGVWNKGTATFDYSDNGLPHLEFSGGSGRARYLRIADREAGALKRLKAIMSRYPTLSYYVQGDPRGCALYILRPGDVPEGKDADAYYSRGVAVFK